VNLSGDIPELAARQGDLIHLLKSADTGVR